MNYILGVINITTNRYENIIFVNKPNKYKCIGCNTELILRKGDKNFQCFVHKNKHECQYFKHPTQDQLLHDAKLYLQTLIEDNKVDIFRKCQDCKRKYNMKLPNYDETKSVKINCGMDIVYLDDKHNDICGFKIYANIPNEELDYECYQINMLDLIQRCVQSLATKKIELVCSKKIICDECKSYRAKYNLS